MEFLGIYGISDSMQTTIETVSDNIFGIVWNSGIQILIFLAALQNIPVSAKEAAQMEGARRGNTSGRSPCLRQPHDPSVLYLYHH